MHVRSGGIRRRDWPAVDCARLKGTAWSPSTDVIAIPRGYGASDAELRLAAGWLTWVKGGPACGPDGVEVAIWIRFWGRDLPYRYAPADQARRTPPARPASHSGYTVCLRRTPGGPVESIRSFPDEASARWYAAELARQVRQAGITALRPALIHPDGPRRPVAGVEDIWAETLVGVGSRLVHGFLWPPRRARAYWRRLRTGRRQA